MSLEARQIAGQICLLGGRGRSGLVMLRHADSLLPWLTIWHVGLILLGLAIGAVVVAVGLCLLTMRVLLVRLLLLLLWLLSIRTPLAHMLGLLMLLLVAEGLTCGIRLRLLLLRLSKGTHLIDLLRLRLLPELLLRSST